MSFSIVGDIIVFMNSATKILQKMRNNQRDWRIDDFEVVARAYRVTLRKSGGSHVIFQHPDSVIALSVPARKTIKPVYVLKFLELISEIERGA